MAGKSILIGIQILVGVIACGFALQATAGVQSNRPVKIATVGPTESTAPWYRLMQARMTPEPVRDLSQALRKAVATLERYRTVRAESLPVRTPNMTPGREPARSFSIPSLPQPVCLVGADQWSQRWIAHHRQRLLDIKAMCIVVEASDQPSLDALAKTLGDIPWFAASATDIANAHQLSHYPVLISREAIEQ